MNKSKLILEEAVPNSKRKTNGAKVYYPALIVHGSGRRNSLPALFSINQILVAEQRAKDQPEDVPAFVEYSKFQKFVAKLVGIKIE